MVSGHINPAVPPSGCPHLVFGRMNYTLNYSAITCKKHVIITIILLYTKFIFARRRREKLQLSVKIHHQRRIIASIIAIIMIIQVIIGLSVKNSSLAPKILFGGPRCPPPCFRDDLARRGGAPGQRGWYVLMILGIHYWVDSIFETPMILGIHSS